MQELILQYLWNHKLYDSTNLQLSDGTPVEVVFQGLWNTDSGPDFFNARIKIGGQLWAGNVEIHYKSSDWYKHEHQDDAAYHTIILHVVSVHDQDVFNFSGALIPCLIMKDDFGIANRYHLLTENQQWVACQPHLSILDSSLVSFWLYRLGIERLEEKSKKLQQWLISNKYHWEVSLFQLLASSFGQKVNAIPFELMARSIDIKIILQHQNRTDQLEALFFGQSGLLDLEAFQDEYVEVLRKEYAFLKHKYKLKGIPGHLWKFMRLRPVNFPGVRIAQFAAFISRRASLLNWVLEPKTIEEWEKDFRKPVNLYWSNHFVFNKTSQYIPKEIGIQSIHSILINAVVPFLFVYGEAHDRPDIKENAVSLLEQIPPELNAISRRWGELGIKAESALQTQALIHLKNAYCAEKRCLHCSWGDAIVRKG